MFIEGFLFIIAALILRFIINPTMMKKILIIITLIPLICFGQKRLGGDLSTKGNNLNVTLTYNHVFKSNFLLSAGLFGGNYGYSGVDLTEAQYNLGRRLATPFNTLNQPITDTSGNQYELFDYGTKGNGVGIQVGLGYFHEFTEIHGIRFNLNTRVGWMISNLSLAYYNQSIDERISLFSQQVHLSGAISPELSHTMRLTGKITFYYGLKFPYYFSLDRAKFNPINPKDLFYFWEPELSAGITYVIGKCD